MAFPRPVVIVPIGVLIQMVHGVVIGLSCKWSFLAKRARGSINANTITRLWARSAPVIPIGILEKES
jgi:hypothetical protein